MSVIQVWRPTKIGGVDYLTCRGRPLIGPQTPPVTARITGLQLFNDARVGVIDPGEDVPTTSDRDSLVYETYRPSMATAGLITDRADLTDYNSPTTDLLTLSANNITITRKRIYGQIKITGSNIRIVDCLLVGPRTTPTTETAVVNLHDPNHLNFVITDCTIEPRWPNQNLDGIKGNNFTARRNHIYWCVDGIGIFNASGSTRPTAVIAEGNLVEAHAYFHGAFYANANGPKYLTTAGTYVSGSSSATVARPTDAWIDTIHGDGNHNDGCQIQGGYGGMTRNAVTGAWTGDGILVRGNYFKDYDARHDMANPWGSAYSVPGGAGSLTGSRLGTQDSARRTQQSPTQSVPASSTAAQYADGEYAANGSSIIVNPGVNAFPFPSVAEPNKYTCVVQGNYTDYAAGQHNIQKGVMSTMKIALLNQKIGGNCYRFPGTSTIYPFRIYDSSTTRAELSPGVKDHSVIQFCPALDGTPGIETHRWYDPSNRFGIDGERLTPGNLTGIVYT